MRRRDLLSTIAATAALPLVAGCIGGPDPGSTPTPADPSGTFRVTARECGEGEDDATVSTADGSILVTGTIGGRDTCDTAALESVERRDGELHVSIVTRREEATETRACAQCITDIGYEAKIHDAGDPSTVVVAHDGTTVTRASP